jgi:hypothetical protein
MFKQGDRVRDTGYRLDAPATVVRTATETGGPFYVVHLDSHAEAFNTLVHGSQVHTLVEAVPA